MRAAVILGVIVGFHHVGICEGRREERQAVLRCRSLGDELYQVSRRVYRLGDVLLGLEVSDFQ